MIEVMCSDCHKTELVDKSVVDKLDADAYCCKECITKWQVEKI